MRLVLVLALGLMRLSRGEDDDQPQHDANTHHIHERIGEALDQYPHLASLQRFFYPRESFVQDEESGTTHRRFTHDQLKYMNKIFKFEPMQKHSAFGKILQGASLPDLSRIQELSVVSVVQHLMDNPGEAVIFMDKLTKNAQRQKERQQWLTEAKVSGELYGEALLSEALYQSCWIDFDGFVKPITQALLVLLCPIICEDLPTIPCVLCNILEQPGELPDWGLTCEYIAIYKSKLNVF